MARFQYIPPNEPLDVTLRITAFLLGLVLLLAGAVVGIMDEANPWSERLVVAGGGATVVAFLMTALSPS